MSLAMNRRRGLAIIISPLLPVLIFALIFIGDIPDASQDNLVVFHPATILVFGLPCSYFFMFLIGLPTILDLEEKRYSKLKTTLIYMLNAMILPCLIFCMASLFITSFFMVLLFIAAPLSLLAGVTTAFIMLYKRHDWYDDKQK